MSDYLLSKLANISIGQSLSGAVQLTGLLVVGIVIPAEWTAANLTFQASADGATYNDLYDDIGTEKTVTAAAARYIIINPTDFAGIELLKVRSGTSGAPVAQAAARELILMVRPA